MNRYIMEEFHNDPELHLQAGADATRRARFARRSSAARRARSPVRLPESAPRRTRRLRPAHWIERLG